MGRKTISQILVAGMFLMLVMSAASAVAQFNGPVVPGQHPNPNQNRAAAAGHPACQRIVNECRRLGYIVGQWKEDNGLWRDCFDPVVHGGTPTRDGHPVQVPVSPQDVQACRNAQARRKM